MNGMEPEEELDLNKELAELEQLFDEAVQK